MDRLARAVLVTATATANDHRRGGNFLDIATTVTFLEKSGRNVIDFEHPHTVFVRTQKETDAALSPRDVLRKNAFRPGIDQSVGIDIKPLDPKSRRGLRYQLSEIFRIRFPTVAIETK